MIKLHDRVRTNDDFLGTVTLLIGERVSVKLDVGGTFHYHVSALTPETLDLPTGLVRAACEHVVPYLPVSAIDRSNSIATHDFSRGFIEALVEEIEAGEPFCDHAVGICSCDTLSVLADLKLRLDGRMTCPECCGDGFVEDYERCDRCCGEGAVPVA